MHLFARQSGNAQEGSCTCPEPLLLGLITGETAWKACLDANADGEQAGSLRLIRADNYFPRIKGLNGEVWGILLHFRRFHCYCCLLSPKIICVQVKNPDMGGHGAARSTPHTQPPLWPPAAGLHPKTVALSTPQLDDMAEATAVPAAVLEPGVDEGQGRQ